MYGAQALTSSTGTDTKRPRRKNRALWSLRSCVPFFETNAMFRLIGNWVRKRLGQHVCEEFTQWQTCKSHKARTPATFDERVSVMLRQTPWDKCNDGLIHYTRRWQERRCTICGKTEQRDLQT